MGIIKTARLIYEYIRRDEEEKIEEVKRAIDGVDLDIEKGSFVAVLGHNGSGKSTLQSTSMVFSFQQKVLYGWVRWIPKMKNTSGMCAKQQEWCSRTRITRSLEIL